MNIYTYSWIGGILMVYSMNNMGIGQCMMLKVR
jgi:hypothetical protein